MALVAEISVAAVAAHAASATLARLRAGEGPRWHLFTVFKLCQDLRRFGCGGAGAAVRVWGGAGLCRDSYPATQYIVAHTITLLPLSTTTSYYFSSLTD